MDLISKIDSDLLLDLLKFEFIYAVPLLTLYFVKDIYASKQARLLLFSPFLVYYFLAAHFFAPSTFLRWFISAAGWLMNMRIVVLAFKTQKAENFIHYLWRMLTFLQEAGPDYTSSTKDGLFKMMLGLGKTCLLYFVVVPTLAEPKALLLLPYSVESSFKYYWYGWALYLGISAIADELFGISQIISGYKIGFLMRAPFLATSTRDFWSNRWNAVFRQLFHSILFSFGVHHPSPVVRSVFGLAVFLFSGLLHEHINFHGFGHASGENLRFFLLHGLVCMVQVALQGKRRKDNPPSLPTRIFYILLQNIFFASTAHLFFLPYVRSLASQKIS